MMLKEFKLSDRQFWLLIQSSHILRAATPGAWCLGTVGGRAGRKKRQAYLDMRAAERIGDKKPRA
jgi:hypothetical protein